MERMSKVMIPQNYEGERLDKFVMNHFKMTWTAAHKVIRMKKAFVISKTAENPTPSYVYKDSAYKILHGDELCYPKDFKADRDDQRKAVKEQKFLDKKQDMIKKLKDMTLFENEHIIVINKDHGVPSQMGSGLSIDNKNEISIDTMLQAYCGEDGKLIHRLDRKTSGLMVLAKSKDMAAYLGKMFKERSVYKAYYALVCGLPKLQSGIIRHSSEHKEDLWEIEGFDNQRTLLRSSAYQDLSKQHPLDMISNFEVLSVSHYDKAISDWNNVMFDDAQKFLKNVPVLKYSYVKYVIETGRKHQIRIQSQHGLGCPIFGDTKYGFEQGMQGNQLLRNTMGLSKNAENQLFDNSIFLHSGELEIPVEPGNSEKQKFVGKMKNQMSKVLDHLHIPKTYYL